MRALRLCAICDVISGIVLAALACLAAPAHGQTVTPISALPAATTPLAGVELVPIVQAGQTRKATVDDIFNPAIPGPLGSGTPSTGAFTSLSASATVSGGGFNTWLATQLASPPAIGGTAPAAITGTNVNASAALDVGGSLVCSATLPTLTGSGFGTSPVVTATTSCAMDITVGSSPAAAAGTITLPTAPDGWVCTGTDITTKSTTVALLQQNGGADTTALIQNYTDVMGTGTAWTAADHLRVACSPF